MATFPTLTQTGGSPWIVNGGGITNHEAFAFTLQSSENDVGALISQITVFDSNDIVPNQTSYFIQLDAMQFRVNPDGSWSLTPTNQGITGNFESNGV
jgi:hypothetical protein